MTFTLELQISMHNLVIYHEIQKEFSQQNPYCVQPMRGRYLFDLSICCVLANDGSIDNCSGLHQSAKLYRLTSD